MKNLKKENGAITIITLVSILFMVSFLISSYILISNKVKAQKDMIAETRKTYESPITMEEIYNSYFNNENIIPIYTVDQLLDMGTEKKNVNIKGKYYDFTNNENTVYVLMNDLQFKANDYADRLDNGYWMPVGDRIIAYETTQKSRSIDESEEEDGLDLQFKAKFEGKNNKIEVSYVDEENDEYSVIYSQESKYCEPEYEVNVTPVFSDETIVNDAQILKNEEQTGLIGQTIIKIKRLKTTSVSAYLDDNYTVPKESILITNPNKIKNVNLKFESLNVVLTIEPEPANAEVMINGVNTRIISVPAGTTVNYQVSCSEYYTKQGSIEVNGNMVLPIELAPKDYVSFSEKFYFTRCSNDTYKGILNGGSATLEKYNVGGADYSMGTFYIDESDIVKTIPSRGIISKVTLYFDYYQTRSNTFLYTNTIKTTVSTGTTLKMTQKESERTDKTVRTAKYELYNISRKDLEEGLSVKLLNYIEGTLTIRSTVKNMYCVIEGEKPDV